MVRNSLLIARDELNDVLHSEFAGELFSGAFELGEQGVEIHELMVQLPGVVTHWARGQPSAAATWVESLPAGEIRTQAMGIVAKEWHNYSASEARKWVESLSQAEQAHVNQLLESP